MFGIAAVVAFALAFFVNVFGWSHGHFTWQAVMLAGLVFLAAHLLPVSGTMPWRRQQ